MMRKWVIIMMVSFLICGIVLPVNATETVETAGIGQQTGLTMTQAVDMALIHSNALKKADRDIDRSWEVRDFAADKVTYEPKGQSIGEASMYFTNLVARDIVWRMSKKTKDAEEDKIVLAVFNDYTNVLKAIDALKNAEDNMANAQWQWNVALNSYQQGVISSSQRTLAESQYNGAGALLKSAKQGLADAYQVLNKGIGLGPGERPVLIEKPEYSTLQVGDVEAAVQRAVENNPTIWMANQNVYLAGLQLDLYNWNDPYRTEPWEAKKIDIDKAELTTEDAKVQFKQFVRTLYNNIVNIEQGYTGKGEALKAAQEGLRVQKAMFEAGMATRGDILAAEATVTTKQKELNEMAYQHELLKLAFEKPWAYAGLRQGAQ